MDGKRPTHLDALLRARRLRWLSSWRTRRTEATGWRLDAGNGSRAPGWGSPHHRPSPLRIVDQAEREPRRGLVAPLVRRNPRRICLGDVLGPQRCQLDKPGCVDRRRARRLPQRRTRGVGPQQACSSIEVENRPATEPSSTGGSDMGRWDVLAGMPRKLTAALRRGLFSDDDTDASAAPGARGMPPDLWLALDADAVAHGIPLEPGRSHTED